MAKAGKQKKSRQQIRLGLFGKLLLLLLLAALGWQLYHLQDQLESAQAQKIQLTAQVRSQQQSNDKLQEAIDGGGTQSQMEEIARDELGLVAPGDRVFYDVSN
ncbi:septum formation initiator family protein [Oscillibacter ruminantium]|uniref:septum formation initiator family protein n=1 Tax=Oscillibacter ruminantium TaxID=1263547 RepID=UPI00031D2B36|nr:septum formation initiator family protein [Oscillibacter ruminantium]MDN0032112.1 septum formation initiator family protein [Oscillibacter valericigenes]MEA5041196.1 septum formation initiator family protein [Oscillibacter ruminantium]